MDTSNKVWKKIDSECDNLENKVGGTLGYGINSLRRVIKWFIKSLEKSGISLVIKIIPKKRLSVLEFEGMIEQTIEESGLNFEKFVLENEKYGKYYFDVNVNYDAFDDKFVEVYEEADEDLDEDVSLENEAKSVSIELIPQNQDFLLDQTENIMYLTIKCFNNLISNLSKKLTYSAKFIFEIRFKKGKFKKIQELEKELNKDNRIKVFCSEYKDFDKMAIVMSFDEINDQKTLNTLLKATK